MDSIGNKGRPGRLILLVVAIITFQSALPGCSPKIVEKIRTEYVYRDVHHRDTTIQHDSVYICEYMKGDTVHHYEYRDRYVYRDRWRDSISIKEVHDTTKVEKKVEKELSPMQKAKIGSFWWLLAGLLGCLGWIFRKPIINLIKTLI